MSSTYPDKQLAQVQAEAALIGASVVCLEDDRGYTVYVLTRNHITRQARTLEEVSVWLSWLSGKILSTWRR
ncbi:MAG: hypothetical protein EON54_07915 [Alcaligenaceae bacterium]|nr:MAG: hypothetical protein EON54_07915 [Alcaligenaceae bacterium]